MYTVLYQYSLIPGIIHKYECKTLEEAQKAIQSFRETGYGAWLKDHNW